MSRDHRISRLTGSIAFCIVKPRLLKKMKLRAVACGGHDRLRFPAAPGRAAAYLVCVMQRHRRSSLVAVSGSRPRTIEHAMTQVFFDQARIALARIPHPDAARITDAQDIPGLHNGAALERDRVLTIHKLQLDRDSRA